MYSRGFISAIADLLPAKIVGQVRKYKAGVESRLPSSESPGTYAARRCREKFAQLAGQESKSRSPGILDNFSSGLTLMGFK